jgi:DNA replication protein DnaC
MTNHHTISQLESLRLHGMAQALQRQQDVADIHTLSFEDRLGLMIEHETAVRASVQLTSRLRHASLRQSASVADIDFRRSRGLSKSMIMSLAGGQWISQHQNILITGATGVGKSFLACALAHSACLNGYTARYYRLSRLLEQMHLARADGTFLRVLKKIARTDLLVIDDWGLAWLSHQQQTDILELLDDRHRQRSTMITSQLPVDAWHQSMADPTLADAILDRLVHTSHTIKLTGESMRKRTAVEPDSDHFRE